MTRKESQVIRSPTEKSPDAGDKDANRSGSEGTEPPSIPDGGLHAWLQVAGAFFIYFNTWGLLSSYGSFQAFYEVDLLDAHTPFEISTVGSLQSFLMVFLGFIAGPVYDAGYFRYMLGAGSLLIAVGTFAQSFCTRLWQLLLAQGVCIGIGAGCLAILSVAIPSLWFSKRLLLANGVAASGSGVGGVVFPVVFRSLQPAIGFNWTARVIALIVILTLGFSNGVMRTPSSSIGKQPRRAFLDRTALHDSPYLLFVAGCFVAFLGLYTPFVYVQSYALETNLAGASFAFYILATLNLASIFGRIVPNLYRHKVSPITMIIMTSCALCLTALCFIATRNLPGLMVVVVLYGFFTGAFFALQPTIFVHLTEDKRVIGTRFGMAFSVMSFALLFGSPIAGALLRAFGYYTAWVWAGVSLAVGGGLMAASRIRKSRADLTQQRQRA